ncbi:MAG: ATP-binding protein [Pseudomonadota bacterium]|nr:ATP-binding protein [Pseudomonadota bacterium]
MNNDFSLEDLIPKPYQDTCPIHGMTEFRAGRCGKCQEVKIKEEQHQKYLNELNTKIANAGLVGRLARATFDNAIALSDEDEKQISLMKRYAENFRVKAKPQNISLILSGAVGTGKTHLACAVAHELLANTQEWVKYTRIAEMIDCVKSGWDNKIGTNESIQKFVQYDLLIIDEIGVSTGSEFEHQILTRIMDDRYIHEKPSILITNLDSRGAQEWLGERVFSRLIEGMVDDKGVVKNFIKFKGKDKRKSYKIEAKKQGGMGDV